MSTLAVLRTHEDEATDLARFVFDELLPDCLAATTLAPPALRLDELKYHIEEEWDSALHEYRNARATHARLQVELDKLNADSTAVAAKRAEAAEAEVALAAAFAALMQARRAEQLIRSAPKAAKSQGFDDLIWLTGELCRVEQYAAQGFPAVDEALRERFSSWFARAEYALA